MCNKKRSKITEKRGFFWKCAKNKNPLQLSAVTGFIKIYFLKNLRFEPQSTAYGNRTRDSSVKGMRLKPLDQRGVLLSSLNGYLP